MPLIVHTTTADPAALARGGRRRPHRSGGRVVAATDSAPVHRGRPRRRHRGARDGAQWPGRARVRTDGARRVHHGSHAGPATGKPPAWSRTTRPARPPNAGPSPSICEGWNGGTAPTAKPQQNHVTQELTPRAHHGHTTVSGESNSGGRTRRTGHAKGHQNNITQELTPATITPSPSCPIRMKVAPCDEDMTLRDAVQHSHLIIQDG